MRITKKLLQRLFDTSPVPVEEMTLAEYNKIEKEFGYEPHSSLSGVYHHNKEKYKNGGVIILNKNMPCVYKFSFYLHELKHHLCNANNCICMKKKNNTLAEYHAGKFQLEETLRLRLPYALEATLMCMNECLGSKSKEFKKYYRDHIIALRKLKKTKLWKNCLKAVRESKC